MTAVVLGADLGADLGAELDAGPGVGWDAERSDRAEARLQRRLRVAGIVTLLAAAIGSAWSASSSGVSPASDDDCVMEVAHAVGFSSGCADGPSADTGR